MKEKNKEKKSVHGCHNCIYSEYEGCKLMCDEREVEVMKNESCDKWRSEWEI